MEIKNTTPFSNVYDSFLSKITEDMYMELNELDTFRLLEELLLNALPKFEFPRQNINDYELEEFYDEEYYSGVESNNKKVIASADLAKLRKLFPMVKFSVTTSIFTGGSEIRCCVKERRGNSPPYLFPIVNPI